MSESKRTRPERPGLLLIIDDDPLIRLVARERLGSVGFEIAEAECGEQGIEAFARLRPDLVLLDVDMPGLDGFEVCAAIRRKTTGKHVPILILTGLNDVDSIERAYQVGATDFASKPLEWIILLHRIRYMLRASDSFQDVHLQQARLDEVQQYAGLGSWEVDVATGLLTGSKALRTILGLDDDSAFPAGAKIFDWIHPSDRESIGQLAAKAIRHGTGFSLDHLIVNHDGSERTVHTRARVRTREDDQSFALEGFTQDITERRRTEERIRFLAYSDSLTGLANRAALKRRLTQAISRARRRKSELAILFLDLDHFKRVNDTFGHAVGDELLQYVAEKLVDCVRASDEVAYNAEGDPIVMISRLGGDEFTVLLEDLSEPSDAGQVARRVLESVSRPVLVEGREISITASIGIAVFPHDGEDEDALLRNADSAMYHAKERGRANLQFYREAFNAHALERLELESLLRRAIEDDRLLVHYQPKLELATGRITGCEALARWLDPERGFIPPDVFIPLSEATGLICTLGEGVLREACRRAREWQLTGHRDLRLAVNLSPLQLKDEHIVETISRVLRETDFDPHRLELEVTESALINNEERARDVLEELRDLGIQISLDDFGTGFSSLSYLKRFPVHTLKIDRTFISGIGQGIEDEAITAAILSMAKDLGIRVVAEGIETEEQLRFLEERGCDEIQGYLLSPPLAPETFVAFLDEHDE